MATSAAFASLGVPAPDDTMEMSSPANRNLDDDIDIDFDDYQGGVHLDDEQMLEDSEQQRPGPATDEVMEEDPLLGEHVQMTEEFTMQEDVPRPLQEEDEELIDYSEGEEYQQDEPVMDAVVKSAIPSAGTSAAPSMSEDLVEITEVPEDVTERVVEESLAASEEAKATASQPREGAEDVSAEADQVPEVPPPGEELEFPATGADDIDHVAEHGLEGEPYIAEPAGDAHPDSHEASVPDVDDEAQPALSIEGSLAVPTDGPSTPTDTGLHPTTIRFANHTLPLFKSRRQPDGLLKDDNLASLSLADLIKNCRERLIARELGENITDEQELILGFDHMGLMLVEDCRAAFECSLNDVIDVYLLLHQNDGVQEAPPLSLNISCQLKFANGFSIFKQAAADGQGMSSFSLLHAGEDEQHGYYGDNFVEGSENEHDAVAQDIVEGQAGFEGQQFDEAGFAEDQDNVDAAFSHAHPDNIGQYAEQYADEPHEDFDEQEYRTEEIREQIFAENALGDTRADGETQGHAHTEEEHDEQPHDATAADDPNNHSLQAPADKVLREANRAASSASSTTVQGEPAHGGTGEYEDSDLIEWDDDSDLTTLPSEQVLDDGGDNDYSTFLTEYGAKDAAATALPKDELALPSRDGVDLNVGGATEAKSADAYLQTTNPESEDWLNDQAYDAPAQGNEHVQEDVYPAKDGLEHAEEDYIDQADTHEIQQEEDEYAEQQPEEVDETQFHSAVDFLDEEYEHGPEHDLYDEEPEFDPTLVTANEVEHTQDSLEDDLAFDDDEDYTHGQTELEATAVGSGSPLGKRSYEEHVEIEGLDDDEPEPKKARNS